MCLCMDICMHICMYVGGQAHPNMLTYFLGYEEIDESKMDPPQAHTSEKATENNPPLPNRLKRPPLRTEKHGLNAKPGVTELNAMMAIDTDSDYEHETTPMEQHKKSTHFRVHMGVTDTTQALQGKDNDVNFSEDGHLFTQFGQTINTKDIRVIADYHRRIMYKRDEKLLDMSKNFSKPSRKVTEHATEGCHIDPGVRIAGMKLKYFHDTNVIGGTNVLSINQAINDGMVDSTGSGTVNGHRQENISGRRLSEGISKLHTGCHNNRIVAMMSHQDLRCSHDQELNEGYQRLIKGTMEPVSHKRVHQELHRDILILPTVTMTNYAKEPAPSRLRINTI